MSLRVTERDRKLAPEWHQAGTELAPGGIASETCTKFTITRSPTEDPLSAAALHQGRAARLMPAAWCGRRTVHRPRAVRSDRDTPTDTQPGRPGAEAGAESRCSPGCRPENSARGLCPSRPTAPVAGPNRSARPEQKPEEPNSRIRRSFTGESLRWRYGISGQSTMDGAGSPPRRSPCAESATAISDCWTRPRRTACRRAWQATASCRTR